MTDSQRFRLVVMGVAGCGKSSLGSALAERLGGDLVEGDDYHSPESRDKMRQGIALNDADRAGWLTTLAGLLENAPGDIVLTCSALRRAYRDQLRAAAPDLRFAFLDITPETARARVAERSAHFFNSKLVDSQFATLEDPSGESGVLRLDATRPIDTLVGQTTAWLKVPA